jgi:hypothetical protein
MATRTPRDLDLYSVVDQKQMKVLDATIMLEWDIGHQKITCNNSKSMP